jgi:hypothetical protein
MSTTPGQPDFETEKHEKQLLALISYILAAFVVPAGFVVLGRAR